MYIDCISTSKTVHRNFPDTAVLDCLEYFDILSNTQKIQGSSKMTLLFQSSLQKGVNVCKSKDIFMKAKGQGSNGRPFWTLFKD